MIALYNSAAEYDAICLYEAMKGLGTNEDTLIEILCTRPNWMLKEVSATFKLLYKKDLVAFVEGDTSGNFRKILVSLLQCNRSETTVPDEEKMKELAHQLYVAGEGKSGTDESFFNKIFAMSSPAEFLSISKWYEHLSNKKLRDGIEKEFSGSIKKALLAIYDGIVDPAEFFAKKVKQSVKGLGTNNQMLIRILVSREEIDLPAIREKYFKLFQVEMVKDIMDDTSGDFKKALVELAQKN